MLQALRPAKVKSQIMDRVPILSQSPLPVGGGVGAWTGDTMPSAIKRNGQYPTYGQFTPLCAPPRQIQLTQGQVTLVDDADFEWLSQWKWCAHKATDRKVIYAGRIQAGKLFLMHRVILGLRPGDGLLTDHRDRNGLNNQRSNLRIASYAQSAFNRLKDKSNLIGIRQRRGKWQARIAINGRERCLGTFRTPEEAIQARDRAALELHGEFAVLNTTNAEAASVPLCALKGAAL